MPPLAHRVPSIRRAPALLPRLLVALAALPGGACAADPPPIREVRHRFEAGTEPGLYLRFRGLTYAEEPAADVIPPSSARVTLDRVAGRPAALGPHALELVVPEGARVLLHTEVVPPGASAVLSAWLRSDRPGRAVLRLFRSLPTGGRAYGARQEERAAREVEVDSRWRRAELRLLSSTGEALYGQLEVAGPRTLIVDGVALGGTTDRDGEAGEPELSVSLGEEPRGIVTAGRSAEARIVVSRALSGEERLRARLRGPSGVASDAGPIRPAAPAGSPKLSPVEYRLALPPGILGPHLLEVELVRGGARLRRVARPYVVLPPPGPARSPHEPLSSRLGTHTRLDPRHLAIAARLGLRWLRLHDTSMVGQWITVEPTPGARRFHDPAVDLAIEGGFGLLGVLEATPRWASAAPATTGWYEARSFPPRDPAAFDGYVRAVVSHYRGRIDRWEVWNEPYLSDFFRGTPADYGALLARALATGRAASASVTLLASAAPEGDRAGWTRAALLGLPQAAAPHAPREHAGPDGYAFHPYDERLVRPPARLAESMTTLRALVGEGRVWATEGAVLGAAAATLDPEAVQPGASTVEAAGAAEVAWAVDLLAAGAERVFAYQLVESPYDNDADLCLLEADGTPRPAAAALAVLAGRIVGRALVARQTGADGIRLTTFAPPAGSGGRALLLHERPDGGLLPADRLPAGATDVWGNPAPVRGGLRLAWSEK